MHQGSALSLFLFVIVMEATATCGWFGCDSRKRRRID